MVTEIVKTFIFLMLNNYARIVGYHGVGKSEGKLFVLGT